MAKEDDVRRRAAIVEYNKKLLQHRELQSRSRKGASQITINFFIGFEYAAIGACFCIDGYIYVCNWFLMDITRNLRFIRIGNFDNA